MGGGKRKKIVIALALSEKQLMAEVFSDAELYAVTIFAQFAVAKRFFN